MIRPQLVVRCLLALFAAVLMSVSAGSGVPEARAGTINYTGYFFTSPYLTQTPYAYAPHYIPQFDLPGQCLTSVCMQFEAHAYGFLSLENYDDFPKVVPSTFAAQIVFLRPDLLPLITLQPALSFSDALTTYDGVVDYAGTSGITHSDLAAVTSGDICLTDPADLAMYIGSGNALVNCSATNTSTQAGANSWSFGVQTYIYYTLVLTYQECSVPAEPTAWGSVKGLYR